MTVLTFRPIDVWPEGWKDPGRRRKTSPFRASWGAYRDAVKLTHPDHGGDPETFRLITEARDIPLNA